MHFKSINKALPLATWLSGDQGTQRLLPGIIWVGADRTSSLSTTTQGIRLSRLTLQNSQLPSHQKAKMLVLLAGIFVVHIATAIMLFVSTISNVWMVSSDVKSSVGLWKNCTNGNCGGSLVYGNEDALKAVQAFMILSIIFSVISLVVFVFQLFTMEKGNRFFLSGSTMLVCLETSLGPFTLTVNLPDAALSSERPTMMSAGPPDTEIHQKREKAHVTPEGLIEKFHVIQGVSWLELGCQQLCNGFSGLPAQTGCCCSRLLPDDDRDFGFRLCPSDWHLYLPGRSEFLLVPAGQF
ncbi:epithelial membrane protein 1 [Cricetulus griseus]